MCSHVDFQTSSPGAFFSAQLFKFSGVSSSVEPSLDYPNYEVRGDELFRLRVVRGRIIALTNDALTKNIRNHSFSPAFMKVLASRIAKELKKAKHCAVYEPDLTRVWPDKTKSREVQIALFAESNGWRLRYYKEGFCAIFDKEPSR